MPRSGQAGSPSAARRRRSRPHALLALLGIVAVVGLCWALIVPPFQAPDEPAHYAYAETLATSFRLPGNAHRPSVSIDEALAAYWSDATTTAFYPGSVPPAWTRRAYNRYLGSHTRGIARRRDGGGSTTASGNPPLYYLYAAVGYLLDPGGTAYGRLYAMRLEGVILLLATALGAWLVAGETFGRLRTAQLATAATAALLPMTTFISTDVIPDALLIPEWTFALWLGARVIGEGARLRDVAGLFAITAAAILTKATSYALVPPVILAVSVGLVRRPRGAGRAAVESLAAGGALLGAPVIAWLAVSRSIGGTAITQVGAPGRRASIGQFVAYVWQFYLPRLPGMRHFRLTRSLPLNEIWLNQGAGSFGWLDVFLPSWMFTLAKALLAGLILVTVGITARLRGGRRLGLLAFDALALLALLALLHVTEYRQAVAGGGQFLQGRYLLPTVGLLGLTVGLGVSRVPRGIRGPLCALVMAGLLAGQAISLATIVHAYYL